MNSIKDRSKLDLRVLLLLLSLVILGTFFRFWMALHTMEWKLASEHNAWQLLLEEALRFQPALDQFIGYPHEMGGALVSAMAFLWAPFQHWIPGLWIGALLVDSLVRLVQVWIAYRLFGRTTAIWFAIWTVTAVPSMINWSFVAVNLHAASAFFPLIIMWLATDQSAPERLPRWLLLGTTVGLAVAWSHSTLTLLPVCLVAVVVTSPDAERTVNVVRFAGVTILIVGPFLLLGWWMNDGYALESYSPFWTQVGNWEPPSFGTWWTRFRLGWTHSFPGSSVLTSFAGLSSDTVRLIWALLVYVGIAAAFVSRHPRVEIWMGLGCFVSFMFFYPVTSFWVGVRDLEDHSAYLYYRHLPLVIPVVVLIAIHGMQRLSRLRWVALTVLVGIGTIAASRSMLQDHQQHAVSYRAQAWVLGRKLAHDPRRLDQLLSLIPQDRKEEFLIGYGWGLADAVLKLAHHPSLQSPQILAQIMFRYSIDQRRKLLEGVDYAFEVTPSLDPGLKHPFSRAMERQGDPES